MKSSYVLRIKKYLVILIQKIIATGYTIKRIVQKPIVVRFLNDNLGCTLDVGAGGGSGYSCGFYTFGYLTQHSNYIYALDISWDSLQKMQSKSRDFGIFNLVLIQSDAEDLPFKDASFDTVLCSEVLEHLENDKKALIEVSRILKRNGRVIISVPVPPAPFKDKYHLREGYTLREISRMLASVSIKVLSHEYCMFMISRLIMKQFRLSFLYRYPLPVPSLFCYLERYLSKYKIFRGRPYNLVVLGEKTKEILEEQEYAN